MGYQVSIVNINLVLWLQLLFRLDMLVAYLLLETLCLKRIENKKEESTFIENKCYGFVQKFLQVLG